MVLAVVARRTIYTDYTIYNAYAMQDATYAMQDATWTEK